MSETEERAAPSEPPTERPAAGAQPRAVRALRAPTYLGTLLAAFALVESWEPTLLVRSWVFQGVVGGLSLVVGYLLGTALTRLAQAARRRWGGPPSMPARADLRLRLLLAGVLVVLVGWSMNRQLAAHRWNWERLGYEPESRWLAYGGTVLVTVVVAAVLFGVLRLLGLVRRRVARAGRLVLPTWIAGGLAFVLVTWVVLAALNAQVLQRTLDGFNASFSLADLDTDGGPQPPTGPGRSGGPGSAAQWDELGREGRRFVTRGPDAAQIGEVAGSDGAAQVDPADVRDPVRVYVGRAAADDVDERVALAMAELERFDAFDRAAVLVVVPTGTGWVNEQVVQPVEYLLAGDTATVAVQYSHLPSPLAFLAEEEAAGDTGAALVEAVRARLAQLPDAVRPALLVAGESLGSFGAAQAFDSLDDLVASTDGSLWVGPPATMHLRREAERVRRPGSPQVKPVVGDGRDVVFANRGADLAGTAPRTVFLQQADDPIVWWDWQTAVREPDWLAEPLDPSVNPEMSWAPLTTFLNLAVDMAVSNDFDEDHGHRYGTQPLTAWHAVLDVPGWDAEAVERLRERLLTIAR